MDKIKYSPNFIGPINQKQFLVFLAGSIIIRTFYKFISIPFTQFIIFSIFIIGVCLYFSKKLKNNIDILKISEDFLKQQQSIMNVKEYRNFIYFLLKIIKKQIGVYEAMIILNSEKGALGDPNIKNNLIILKEKNEFLTKEMKAKC